MVALLGGAVAVALGTAMEEGSSSRGASPPARTTPPSPARSATRPAPAKGAPVRLTGVAAFDPDGDGRENDQDAAKATDGDAASFWRSERYRSFFKPGVGLVLDAGRPIRIGLVRVRTDSPGFVAEIRVGDAAKGPFTPVSSRKTVRGATVFRLRDAPPARYVLVWVVDVPDGSSAHVNEVTARAAP